MFFLVSAIQIYAPFEVMVLMVGGAIGCSDPFVSCPVDMVLSSARVELTARIRTCTRIESTRRSVHLVSNRYVSSRPCSVDTISSRLVLSRFPPNFRTSAESVDLLCTVSDSAIDWGSFQSAGMRSKHHRPQKINQNKF